VKAKVACALTATALFLLLLATAYVLHARYLRVDVVLYAALQDAAIAVALTAIALFTIPAFGRLSSFERIQLITIVTLLGYVCAISVPTLIDRSLSFYILEKLEQRGGGIREDAFPALFTDEYLTEYRLVDVRLTEQLESGTIAIKDGCVRLTPKGRTLAHGSSWFRKHLLPRERLLRGEYNSSLTTPFRDSPPSPDYRCR
jgi:hypothetical protein